MLVIGNDMLNNHIGNVCNGPWTFFKCPNNVQSIKGFLKKCRLDKINWHDRYQSLKQCCRFGLLGHIKSNMGIKWMNKIVCWQNRVSLFLCDFDPFLKGDSLSRPHLIFCQSHSCVCVCVCWGFNEVQLGYRANYMSWRCFAVNGFPLRKQGAAVSISAARWVNDTAANAWRASRRVGVIEVSGVCVWQK